MRHDKLFRWWFAFIGAVLLVWVAYVIYAIIQVIDILRLWVLT